MITCNLCGNRNPTGTVNCQRCGTLLASDGNNGINPTMTMQEQPALPAWLESLRSDMAEKSEKPTPSENSRSNYNAANMVDNGAFPSWTQPERAQAEENARTDMQEGLRSSSYPAPQTDESFFAGEGIAASSLVDQQALPPWMQQEKNIASQGPQRNIPASSLIQHDAMPAWMTSMQPSQPQVPPATGLQAQQMPQMPQMPPPVTPPAGQNFSARELIDQQSLPSWMNPQNTQNVQQQQYPAQGVGQQPEQGGMFSASSLLDENSLPSWMRENAQGQRPTYAPSAPLAQLQPQQNASWQAAQSMPSPQAQQNVPWQAQAAQPQGNAQGSNAAMNTSGTLSASSFIDVNALPSWLRPAEGNYNAPPVQGGMVDSGQSGQSGQQRQGPYAASPRVDNVRVPSRPRGETGSNEGSEVAANVFASMLGVASTAPNFPMHGQGSGQAPMQGAYGQPNGQRQPQGMAPMGTQGVPQGFPMVQQPMQNNNGAMPQQGYMQGPYSNNYAAQGNYPGNPSMQQPAYMAGQQGAMNGFNMAQGNPGMNGEQRTNAKPAKRGLFEAIRSLFFRS